MNFTVQTMFDGTGFNALGTLTWRSSKDPAVKKRWNHIHTTRLQEVMQKQEDKKLFFVDTEGDTHTLIIRGVAILSPKEEEVSFV